MRHSLLIVAVLACLAFSVPPMPLKPVLRSPKDQANQPVSPVRPGRLQAAPIGLRRVTLAYDLQPVDGYTQWGLETGLSASTNLVNWSVVWFEPYPTSTHVQVTLSNQPPYCFYRAFWRNK